MSSESVDALYRRISTDQQFRTDLATVGDSAAKNRYVTQAGYDLSPGDLPKIRQLAGVGDMSRPDLEKVAHGRQAGPTAAGSDPAGTLLLQAAITAM